MIIVNRFRFICAYVISTVLLAFAVNESMLLLGAFAIWFAKTF